MRGLTEALQVKDTSVFELLQYTFFERDFVFFTQLTAHLGELTKCPKGDAEAFGLLSELLYLSSLLHSVTAEVTESIEQLRGEKQMPVLLGDLLYGHFLSALVETQKSAYLPIYIAYLKQFNQDSIEALEAGKIYGAEQIAQLLAAKTAEVMAAFTGQDASRLSDSAMQFCQQYWHVLQGEKVNSLFALDQLLQGENSQGAMVC